MQNKAHFAWIDVLRGLSALAIVLFHARVTLWVGWTQIRATPEQFSTIDRLAAFLSLPVPFFGSAVMLFFLISGFCIHYPYANRGREFQWKSYLWRRWGRIYPPYFAIVLIGIGLECYLFFEFKEPASSVATWWKSVVMLENYGPDAGRMMSNPSLWSLPVEAELYLVYPLFLWMLQRHGLKYALLLPTVVSLAALVAVLKRPDWIVLEYNFALYWLMWCSGAACAELAARQRLPAWRGEFWVLMLLSLLFSCWLTATKHANVLQNWSWVVVYLFILLRGLTISQNRLGTEPSMTDNGKIPGISAVLARIGVFSYSLYLIHYPFFTLCGAIWIRWFGSKPANFLVTLGFCLVALVLAPIFYRFIEDTLAPCVAPRTSLLSSAARHSQPKVTG